MSKTKKYLMLLAAIGLIATAAGGVGTFASFNAEVTNSGNVFQTGSLVLNDQANSQTACLSYNGTDNRNSGCATGQIINVAAAPGQKPGSTIATGTVVVKNDGTLDASKLTLFAPSASDCQDTQVTALGTLNSTAGNPLCHALVMYVQETAQSGGGTKTYCWYGYSSDSNTTCNAVPLTLDAHATNTLASFDTATAATPIELLPLTSSGTTGSGTELAAGASRTFQIGLYLPSGTGNSAQALKSTFALTWHIDQ